MVIKAKFQHVVCQTLTQAQKKAYRKLLWGTGRTVRDILGGHGLACCLGCRGTPSTVFTCYKLYIEIYIHISTLEGCELGSTAQNCSDWTSQGILGYSVLVDL